MSNEKTVDALAWMGERIAWNRAHPLRYRARRLRHRLTHPVAEWRGLYWPVRSFVERGCRGWAVSDTWSFDTYISRVMAEALAHMRRVAHGYPGELSPEKWDAILAEIEGGFRCWADHDSDPDDAEAFRRVQGSLVLLQTWFGHLWD